MAASSELNAARQERQRNFLHHRGLWISPSLLSADFLHLGESLEKVSQADALHFDIMDGHFVPNISYGAGIVRQCRPASPLFFDVHLMVSEPERWIADFAAAGADLLSLHWEATAHAPRHLAAIHEAGMLAGITLNPQTPAEVVRYLLSWLDYILVMTVNPGFGGQTYLPDAARKLREIAGICASADHPIVLAVDGGINKATIKDAAAQGARYFVAGSAVYGAADPAAAVEALRSEALPLLRGSSLL